MKWKHSSSIKRLLLDIEPDLDKITYLILKYGPIAKIYYCFYTPSYTCKYNDCDNDHNHHHNHHRGGNDDAVVRSNGHDDDDDKGNTFSSVINWNKDRSNSNKILVTSKDQYDDNDGNNDEAEIHGKHNRHYDITEVVAFNDDNHNIE